MTLFDDRLSGSRETAPLAVRMRPRDLDEVVGQDHVVGPESPLRRLIAGQGRVSVILWGPPGSGKTTLATLVSTATGRRFVELSAVTAGVKDVREVVERARNDLAMGGVGTVLFVDEVHRFSKTQQDALLPAVENGWVTLIAATTENPSFSVVAPLLSRSLLLTLHPLDDDAIGRLVDRAVAEDRGLGGRISLTAEARKHLVRIAGGDARRALTALEAAASGSDGEVDLSRVEAAVLRAAVRYDRDGDQHYDVVSALIKSIRGSDVDASLHYLARMIEAGEDPRFVARRLVILASEDIGMADSGALVAATAAAQVVALVGMPEGRYALAQATVHLALAPKSNAVSTAIDEALADVRRGLLGTVPAHLRDAHYPGASQLGHGSGYAYPHDSDEGVVAQQYAPDPLMGRRYFRPTSHGAEARWAEVHRRIQGLLAGAGGTGSAVAPEALGSSPRQGDSAHSEGE